MGVAEFFTRNLKLKGLALGFAVALWFFVAGQSYTEVGFLVPLGFKGTPRNMIMTGSPVGDIEVRVKGPRLLVNNLSPSQISVEVDLSGAKEGPNTLRLSPADVITPMGVRATWIKPNSVDVRMERLVSVTLPVKVRFKGRPAYGYRIAGANTLPVSVTAEVLKKDLTGLEAIYTRPVDIEGLDSSKILVALLDLSGSGIRNVSTDKATVRVVVEKER